MLATPACLICPALQIDRQIAKEFQKTLKKQGFNFHLGQKVTKSEVKGDGVTLTIEPSKGTVQLQRELGPPSAR